MLQVAAGVILRGGRVLIAQRKDDCSHEPGKWEFPGGKIEPGETPQECLRREIAEELGIDIEVGKPFCVSEGEGVALHVFLARPTHGEPEALDVKDWRWAGQRELPDFSWAKADIAVMKRLLESGLLKK